MTTKKPKKKLMVFFYLCQQKKNDPIQIDCVVYKFQEFMAFQLLQAIYWKRNVYFDYYGIEIEPMGFFFISDELFANIEGVLFMMLAPRCYRNCVFW